MPGGPLSKAALNIAGSSWRLKPLDGFALIFSSLRPWCWYQSRSQTISFWTQDFSPCWPMRLFNVRGLYLSAPIEYPMSYIYFIAYSEILTHQCRFIDRWFLQLYRRSVHRGGRRQTGFGLFDIVVAMNCRWFDFDWRSRRRRWLRCRCGDLLRCLIISRTARYQLKQIILGDDFHFQIAGFLCFRFTAITTGQQITGLATDRARHSTTVLLDQVLAFITIQWFEYTLNKARERRSACRAVSWLTGHDESQVLQTVRCSIRNRLGTGCIRSTSVHEGLIVLHSSFLLRWVNFFGFQLFIRCFLFNLYHWMIFIRCFPSFLSRLLSRLGNKFILIVVVVVVVDRFANSLKSPMKRDEVTFSLPTLFEGWDGDGAEPFLKKLRISAIVDFQPRMDTKNVALWRSL